jgi:hypothetical protein
MFLKWLFTVLQIDLWQIYLSFELMLPDLIPYSIVCLHLISFSTNDFYIGTVTRGLFGWSKTTPARSFVAFGPNFLKIVDAGRKRHGHWALLYLL